MTLKPSSAAARSGAKLTIQADSLNPGRVEGQDGRHDRDPARFKAASSRRCGSRRSPTTPCPARARGMARRELRRLARHGHDHAARRRRGRTVAMSGSSCRARGSTSRWPRSRSSAGRENVARRGEATQSQHRLRRARRSSPSTARPTALRRGEVDHPHRPRRRPLVGSRPQGQRPGRPRRRLEPDRQRPAHPPERLPRRPARRVAQAGLDANGRRRRRTRASTCRRATRRPSRSPTAFADYAQHEFAASSVVDNPKPADRGWAVGGQTGRPHALTLVLKDADRGRAGLDADRSRSNSSTRRARTPSAASGSRPPTTTARSNGRGRRRTSWRSSRSRPNSAPTPSGPS